MNTGNEKLRRRLTLGHLYPDQLNLYGDRGNILTLQRRCQLRGIALRVVSLGVGDALAPDEYDMLFIGGGQDKEQAPVALDLYETKVSAGDAAVYATPNDVRDYAAAIVGLLDDEPRRARLGKLGRTENEVATHILVREVYAMYERGFHDVKIPVADQA